MIKKLYWKFLNVFFPIIRPFYVNDIDSNEDYICCYCCKPVLKRYLFCSAECEDKSELF